MASHFSIVDYVIFGVSLVLSLAVGVYHAWHSKKLMQQNRKASHTLEYLMGGRKMPILPIAFSVMSTFLSGISLLGVPAEVYVRGLLFWLYYMVGAVALIISAIFFLPIFYRLRPISIYEYFEHRFRSVLMRRLAATLFVINTLFYIAVVMYAPSIALSGVTGVPAWPFIIVVGIVCTFYCTFGGLKAVVWTDTLQAVFMYGGVLAVIIQGTIDVGGIGRVFEINMKSGRIAELSRLDPNPAQYMSVWITVFGGVGFWLSLYGLNQMAMQRYCSLPSLRHAHIVIAITAPAYLILGSLCVFVGMVMLAYFYECDPLITKEVSTKDQLVILFVAKILGKLPGLPGLFLACLFSGTLSTVSSGINSMAAVTYEDFLRHTIMKRFNDNRSSTANKLLVLSYGVLGTGLAFAVGPMGGVVKTALSMMGTLAGPLVGLFFLGVFVPRANKLGAFIGAIVASAVTSWLCIGSAIHKPYAAYNLATNGTCAAPQSEIDLLLYANSTASLYANSTTSLYANMSFDGRPDLHYGDRSVFWGYRISTYLYPMIGIILVLIIGTIVSYLQPSKQGYHHTYDEQERLTFIAGRRKNQNNTENTHRRAEDIDMFWTPAPDHYETTEFH